MTPDAAYLYVGQVPPRIRFATTADATSIERIENDADRLLIDRLEPDACHLEQLSVSPAFAQRGLGRALTEAAKRHAGERGHSRITLRTFADVPWNAPFYATVGFAEEEPSTAFHRSLVEVEARLGLDRYGRRVQMGATLRPASAVH